MATFAAGGPNSVLTALSTPESGVVAQYDPTGVVTLNYKVNGELQTASFDMSSPEDLHLLAELQMFHMALQDSYASSQDRQLASDSVPDLYAFSYSGVDGLVSKYGQGSPQFVAALRLMDASVPVFLNQLSLSYNKRIMSQVLLLGSSSSPDVAQLTELVQKVMPGMKVEQDLLPALYLKDRTSTYLICQKLTQAAAESQSDFSVHCPKDVTHHARRLLQVSPGAAAAPTADDIGRYQIMVWLSIMLAFTVIAAAYSLGFMSFKKDTLLYSTFNPKWEDRKTK